MSDYIPPPAPDASNAAYGPPGAQVPGAHAPGGPPEPSMATPPPPSAAQRGPGDAARPSHPAATPIRYTFASPARILGRDAPGRDGPLRVPPAPR